MAFRGFVAVDVGPLSSVLQAVSALERYRHDLKVVAPENIHLTLKFLGNVEDAQAEPILEAIEEACEGVDPFTMTLKGMGTFPPRGPPRVVWIGLEGADPLVQIAQALEDSLEDVGFARERRAFSPHVTLARARSPGGARNQELIELVKDNRDARFGTQDVQEIRLMRSELRPTGPIYSVVGAVPLGG